MCESFLVLWCYFDLCTRETTHCMKLDEGIAHRERNCRTCRHQRSLHSGWCESSFQTPLFCGIPGKCTLQLSGPPSTISWLLLSQILLNFLPCHSVNIQLPYLFIIHILNGAPLRVKNCKDLLHGCITLGRPGWAAAPLQKMPDPVWFRSRAWAARDWLSRYALRDSSQRSNSALGPV